MLRWRAATRLINLYMPEVLFGLGVADEAEVRQARVQEVSTGGGVVADLNRQIAASKTAAVSEPEIVEEVPIQESEPAQDSATDMEVVDAPVDPF